MLVFRLFFTFYFGDLHLITENLIEVLYAFFYGFRYDSMVLSYMLFPLYLLSILVSLVRSGFIFRFFQLISVLYLFIFSIIIPFILISDLSFYSYFQDHINILFFGLIEDDTAALMESIWNNYPLGIALSSFAFYAVVSLVILLKVFKKIPINRAKRKGSSFQFLAILLGTLILFVGGSRGGFGQFVLAPKYADFSRHEFINSIALNGVISLDRAVRLRLQSNSDNFNVAKKMGYSNNYQKAFSDFLGVEIAPTKEEFLLDLIKRKTPFSKAIKEEKLNVIVLVMESFGGHWIQYNSPSFNFMSGLEKHFEEDYYFKNFISSENGTIGSLVAISSNLPHIPGKRYLSESKYMQIPLDSAAHIPYLNSGYETNFVYGGKLGWRDIGKYMRFQKYHNIVGENEIITQLGLDKNKQNGTEWGLYDEYFFDFIYKQLTSTKTPQFILGLSTSNHPPFKVPDHFKAKELIIPMDLESKISREKDLFIKRFEAFQYANDSLSKFISKIKESEIGKRTLIAVTGDHNFWGFMNYDNKEMYSKYTVPFYIYVPSKIKVPNANLDKVGSHEDIMPTLYNLSLSEVEYLSFGEDLFSTGASFAMNSQIQASANGLIYKNKAYNWTEIPNAGDTIEDQGVLSELLKRYKSTLTLVDFYLEKRFRQKPVDAKSDQQ